MRKNLTISLAPEDWKKVQLLARKMGGTYSEVFHRLLQAAEGGAVSEARVAKYRAQLAPQADFLARRAALFAKGGRRGKAR